MLTNTYSESQIPYGQFHFNWGRHLGAGGLGRVDEIIVVQSNTSIPVNSRLACKRLNDKWKDHPQARERFEREITALRRMNHPSIVKVEAENLTGSSERFYMMPLYSKSLRDLLATVPNGFSWTHVARFAARIADAMAYAHDKGFIHRDIKPENILLTEETMPVIADWGLGYFVHKESKVLQQLTRGGMGTEYYCSMEQWNTGKCDETGDVYSLGVMTAELATGHQVPMAWEVVGTGINVDVVDNDSRGAQLFNLIVKNMTQLLPKSRIQSMTEVARQLRMAVNLSNTAL